VAQDIWQAVDDYITEALVKPDSIFEEILRRSDAAGLPGINVTPAQGKFLQLLARALSARSILEIGTLGGYSTTWLAGGLAAGGRLVTIEAEPRHAQVAKANLELAGVADKVEVVVGQAVDVLERLAAEGRRFDLVFIDADKPGYPNYFAWSVRLSRPGTVIVADNVVRAGQVADPATKEAGAQAIRRFNEAVASEPRASATAIQTVGAKGYDGFALIVVGPE
jgi:predicted O-methyltransferase YrrM